MVNKMYPLKFEPIYQYRLWGGRNLAHLLSKPLPVDENIGEAWILSDRKDHASKVVEGSLKDSTLTQLMEDYRYQIMGKNANDFDRFPLLLKFLDCNEVLSVQVHPSDDQKELIPPGDTGKTEAWVVLETNEKSRIYSGLVKGTTKENLRESVKNKTVGERLHSFIPKKGDAVFIHSGTVHTLSGTVVFEVQENSDVTLRLYDWDRIDAKTGERRELQVDKAIECIDFNQVDIGPVTPKIDPQNKNSEKLFDDDHFILWRIKSDSDINVGFKDEPAILVCINGSGSITFDNTEYVISKGEVLLLPAIIGQQALKPENEITLLQIAIPATRRN